MLSIEGLLSILLFLTSPESHIFSTNPSSKTTCYEHANHHHYLFTSSFGLIFQSLLGIVRSSCCIFHCAFNVGIWNRFKLQLLFISYLNLIRWFGNKQTIRTAIHVPIRFTISPWLSINWAMSKNMSWSSVIDFSRLKNISCRFWISLIVCLL